MWRLLPERVSNNAVMGYATPSAAIAIPPATPASTATTVAYLAYQDMHGALASYTSAIVQICSKNIGLTNSGASNQTTNCKKCTSSSDAACSGTGAYTPSSDPESPTFYLHRVDVTYTFTTLIPGTVFNMALAPTTLCPGGTCTFHRQVSMRLMD